MSLTQQPEAEDRAPDYRLHCRACGAGFYGMLEKLQHQEHCGQLAKRPGKPRRKAPKVHLNGHRRGSA